MKNNILLIILMLIGAGSISAQVSTPLVYDAPDQAVWDSSTRNWYVSNLGGGISLERDGNGWIVKLDETGAVVDPRWVEGLDAPSGMVVAGDLLYVVDRDGLYEIEIATAKIKHLYKVDDPVFLNDVALSPDGELYMSDFSAQRIYRIDPKSKAVEIFIESDDLDTPDGLYVDGNKLIVASWGPIVDPATFGTSRPGSVLSVDLNTKKISSYLEKGLGVGNLEGIAKAGDDYYITDWMSGYLLRVGKSGFDVVLSGLQNPTDPNYAEELGILAIPQHGTNQVLFIDIAKIQGDSESANNYATGVVDYGIIVRDIEKSVRFYESIGLVKFTEFGVPSDISGDSGLTDYKELAVVMMTTTGGETDTKIKLMQLPGKHKKQD